LLSVFLVDDALEFRRDLQPSFFVDASWVIAAKHELAGVTAGLQLLPAVADEPQFLTQGR
jgi:hypothetical protein